MLSALLLSQISGRTAGNLGQNAAAPPEKSGCSVATYPAFRHAYTFERDTTMSGYSMQAPYVKSNPSATELGDRYPIKMGFYTNDRYLIGTMTCGSYLYLSPASYPDLLVDGTDYKATRNIEYGETNRIEIPVIFQHRMTDYYGEGSTGTGRVGGSDLLVNLTYSKKIGIDVSTQDSTFSFDLQVYAKYKSDTPAEALTTPVKTTVALNSKFREYNSKYGII